MDTSTSEKPKLLTNRGPNTMQTMCSDNAWRAIELLLRGIQELIDKRKDAGKSTAIDRISFTNENQVRTQTIHWSEP